MKCQQRRFFRIHWPLALGFFATTMALFGLFSFSREQIDQNLFERENNERIAKRQSELELVEKELNETKQHILDEIENGEREKEKCGGKAKGWASKNNNRSASDPFPTDLFSLEQLRHGAVLLHFCGLVYMFVALAIVCDEFFVPSLSVITEELKISDDVAGATFMAAGGSAPEFFTSLFGVFITENNVGVGTIVGSATFNILCVLACCTLFSRSTLSLTWWPLFRDILFYSVALLILSFFLLDERIHWIEAAIMFTIYLCYAIFMKFNSRIELAVKNCFVRGSKFFGFRIEPSANAENPSLALSSAVPLEAASESAARGKAPKESAGAGAFAVSQHPLAQPADLAATDPCALFVCGRSSISVLHAGAHYPQIYPGIVQIALDPRNFLGVPSQHSRKVAFTSRISNQSLDIDRRRKKRRLDKAKSLPSFNLEQSIGGECNGNLKAEPSNHFRAGTPYPPPMALSPSSASFTPISFYSCSLNGAGGGLPPVNVPAKTFLKKVDPAQYNQTPPIRNAKPNKAKSAAQTDQQHKNGTTTDEDGASADIFSMTPSEIPSANGEIPSKNGGGDDEKGDEAEEEKPVDLSWPQGTYKQFVFLLLAPIMFPLALTLPDVKRQERKKYVGITFIGSVAWIAFFTYMMVWWATTIGQTLGVPTEVIGLTILAAGTSIPDLITSVIVSRKGLGDMAVSSSIGSNLFDICVGLPIPWLLHFGLRNGFIPVQSNGLLCSIAILFLMLFVLVIAVTITRWRMNKVFGMIMFCAYLLFCLLSVLLEKSLLYCPLKLVRKGNWC
ncbi:hypothetical protein niasHT_037471 [Heterodera trifolii]|uniref:Sodium/calcium exchanger membrane region domain-containing protein n=1 Tax=Heterodera trifolii TaxID=157864 RepID=A0ABD2J4Q1_9BILA